VPLDGQYASWVGTLVGPDDRLVLVSEPARTEEAVMRLARVGYENLAGVLDGGVQGWAAAGRPLKRAAAEPVTTAIRPGRRVLDVRRAPEWNASHLEGARHIPLAQLPARATELDRGAEWVVVCASGYRSSIALSVLERAGFSRLVNAAGGMDAWRRAGMAVATG
jgi:rhodanese-related sulfurtransferase